MQQLMLLAGVGLAIFAFTRWSNGVGSAKTAQVLRRIALAAAVVVVLGLVARGGAALLVPLLIALLPILLRVWYAWQRVPARNADGHEGASSTIETHFFRMSLDHGTGDMQGTVLTGKHKDRELRELALSELLWVWRECQNDPQSVAVLEAYLDRVHGNAWRDRFERDNDTSGAAQSSPMSREEAFAILGLEPGASADEIKSAHRRLMQRVHPDHGGSNYLAARINQAKEYLLQSKYS